MTNDNKPKLKADHRQHSDTQPPKQSKPSFIGFISIIAVFVMLLLIAACQPVNAHTFKSLEVTNHE